MPDPVFSLGSPSCVTQTSDLPRLSLTVPSSRMGMVPHLARRAVVNQTW